MTNKKLSINKICILFSVLFFTLSFTGLMVIFILTKSLIVMICQLIYIVLTFLCVVIFIMIVRGKLTVFSDALCEVLDTMLNDEIEFKVPEEEDLFYKIKHRLIRMYEIMQENKQKITKQKADLQELISDISHQVKTPLANLKMIDATLLEQNVPKEKQKEFLEAMGGQLEKLDFLMQAMIKTSRLETGVISLEKRSKLIFDTLAAALGGILLNAEKKQIQVEVDCPESLLLAHDTKWTSEALFNILDNAIKYTPEGGHVSVTVKCLEVYIKIDISDTGRGILEQHQGAIFRRFYREESVHHIDGIGIGLYLSREIISMQGGYIKVVSSIGNGTTFSVFLPY